MRTFLKTFSTQWLNTNVITILPIFFATNLAAVTVWQLNASEHTMALVLGIIAGGLADLDNRLTGRLKNLFFSLVAFAVSALSAQLALSYGWLFIPLITMITFVVIMLGAIGPRYSTIAFSTLLVAVYTTLTYTPTSLWYSNPLLIVLGALLYGIVATLVYLCFPHRAMQDSIADYFVALGHYLQIKSDFFDPDDTDSLPSKQLALAKANAEVMAAFDKARVALFYRLRLQHRHQQTQKMLRYYFTGQDIWERASSNYAHYTELFQSLQHSDLIFRFQRLLELQAIACRQIATSLRYAEHYQPSHRAERVLAGLKQSLQFYRTQGIRQFYQLQSIADNLQHIEEKLQQLAAGQDSLSSKLPKTARLIGENVSSWREIVQAIRSQCHLNSQLFRHAMRLSIVVFASSLFVEIFHVEQGYWILLTAILVCQPNYSATKKRLIQRVVGTILGVIIGFGFRYLSPTLEAQLGLLVAFSTLFFVFRTNNYSFSTFFITIQVLISFDIVGFDPDAAMLPRILDTLLGAGIAWLAVSYLWPDWKYVNLHQSLQHTLKSSAVYLIHIIAQLQFGQRDHFSYRVARRASQNAVATLSTTVSNMLGEPRKYRHSLEAAPMLLGLSYTLMSYISALGAYRNASERLNHQIDFAAVFFKQSKKVASLLEQLADAPSQTLAQISTVEQELQQFEQQPMQDAQQRLLLIQQLRLIVQLLPQFATLIRIENN